MIESVLDEEMADDLGYDNHDPTGRKPGTHCNGKRTKTVQTDIAGALAEQSHERTPVPDGLGVSCLNGLRVSVGSRE